MMNNLTSLSPILLVEDDRGDQILAKRAFAEAKITNKIYTVETGEEALDFLLRRGEFQDPSAAPRPGIVILDLNLPKLTGHEVLRQIRSSPSISNIPVIMLTTSRVEQDMNESYALGANSYISKPIEVPEFLRAISEIGSYWLHLVMLPTAEDSTSDHLNKDGNDNK